MNTGAGYSVNALARLMQRATMSTTYKPALLRALAAICDEDDADDIPLARLGWFFARLYWD